MKLSSLIALPLVTATLLPRQDDPRVSYPELSTCFRVCFDNEINKICAPTDLVCFCSQPQLVGGLAQCLQTECENAADVEKALAFGVQFCQAGGIAVTPTLNSIIPTSTGVGEMGPSSVGNGIGTIPAGSTDLVISDATSDLIPAESTPAVPTSTSESPVASTGSVVQTSSQAATSSIAATTLNAASSVRSSASSAVVSAAAATASPSNAAGGLVVPSTGLFAGVLAVVLAM